ncbi:NRDE family protein, partial [Endobacter medicaginis]
MCTVIVSLRPGAAWPLHVAANRDERLDRPWTPPGRHWPVQPDAFGPRDDLVGGSWLTVNEAGVVGAVMNRSGSLGPAPGKRSRGDLP